MIDFWTKWEFEYHQFPEDRCSGFPGRSNWKPHSPEGSRDKHVAKLTQGRVVHSLRDWRMLSLSFFPKPAIWLAVVAWRKCFYFLTCKFYSPIIKEANTCLSQHGMAKGSIRWQSTGSGHRCSPETAVGGHPSWGGYRPGDLKSLFLPEQWNSQSHMLQVGQLVCKTAEVPDFNCPGGLFVDYVGSNFKHGFKFTEPWIQSEWLLAAIWVKEKKCTLAFSSVS